MAELFRHGDQRFGAVLRFSVKHPQAKENSDIIWIRAQTLANDEKRRDEALAFVDAQRARLKNPAEILVTKGYVLYISASGTRRDEVKLKLAFAAYEEARQIDPKKLNALYLPGAYLNGLRRSDETKAEEFSLLSETFGPTRPNISEQGRFCNRCVTATHCLETRRIRPGASAARARSRAGENCPRRCAPFPGREAMVR